MAKIGFALGALAGSLAGGVAITGMMLAEERKTGRPSELTELARATTARAGVHAPTAGHPPTPKEQAATQGGHLLLSALGGLAYAAAFDEDAPVVLSGLGFGAAFYALAHVAIGPALGVKAPEWRQDPLIVGKHLIIHALFGLLISAGACAGAALDN